ncbi:MAG: hexokinase family protein [Candidatus Levyibacteriota bacterium]
MTPEELLVITKNFVEELEHAKNALPSSLSFIKNTIPSIPLITDAALFEVMVIGGTVFQKALCKKDNGAIVIVKVEEKSRPLFPTKNDFLSFVKNRLDKNCHFLAINFAHAMQPVFEKNKVDGIFLFPSKENLYEGLVGEKVGEEIEKYCKNSLSVSVANDTICLLLAGKDTTPWEASAGGIVGTGVNFAFFDKENEIINLEAGRFNKFVQTETGKIIDKNSVCPNEYLFEKEVSGAYLFEHFNLFCQQKNISYSPLKNSEELNNLAADTNNPRGEIARNIITHSAQLVACEIAGITFYKKQNMTFLMEGSIFWKGYQYKKIIEETVRKLCPEFSITFENKKNADIIGAAKLLS